MRTYRARLTDGTIIEGSYKQVYRACIWEARNNGGSAEITDALREDWCKLNNIPCLPHTTIRCFSELKLVYVIGPSGKDLWYKIAEEA